MRTCNRDYCNMLSGTDSSIHDILHNEKALYLPREKDIYNIYICLVGRNCATTINTICRSLRKALINLYSEKVQIYFLDDASTDTTQKEIDKHALRNLSRYTVKTIRNESPQGGAYSRITLLNELRKNTGRKLVCMLGLDIPITPHFGRYVHTLILQGYQHAVFSAESSITKSLSAIYPKTSSPIIWWEETDDFFDKTLISAVISTRKYPRESAFYKAIFRTLPDSGNVAQKYKTVLTHPPTLRHTLKQLYSQMISIIDHNALPRSDKAHKKNTMNTF